MITKPKTLGLVRPGKSLYREEFTRLVSALRAQREARGLSQAEVGMLVGRDQTFVSKYEKQVQRIDVVELHDLCRVLELDFHHLLKEIFGE